MQLVSLVIFYIYQIWRDLRRWEISLNQLPMTNPGQKRDVPKTPSKSLNQINLTSVLPHPISRSLTNNVNDQHCLVNIEWIQIVQNSVEGNPSGLSSPSSATGTYLPMYPISKWPSLWLFQEVSRCKGRKNPHQHLKEEAVKETRINLKVKVEERDQSWSKQEAPLLGNKNK